jgi:hypothetical protein
MLLWASVMKATAAAAAAAPVLTVSEQLAAMLVLLVVVVHRFRAPGGKLLQGDAYIHTFQCSRDSLQLHAKGLSPPGGLQGDSCLRLLRPRALCLPAVVDT